VQGLRRVGTGDMLSAGDMAVNGGEFLFVRDRDEKVSLERLGEKGEQLPQAQQTADEGSWRMEWCHRMKNTRDHTEVEDLKIVLGLSPARERKSEEMDEKQPEIRPMMRRATTTKLHRAMSKRSQSFMSTLTRSHTMRSGAGVDSRPKMTRFHSHSASVQVVSAL
jgi:hypothetical protein